MNFWLARSRASRPFLIVVAAHGTARLRFLRLRTIYFFRRAIDATIVRIFFNFMCVSVSAARLPVERVYTLGVDFPMPSNGKCVPTSIHAGTQLFFYFGRMNEDDDAYTRITILSESAMPPSRTCVFVHTFTIASWCVSIRSIARIMKIFKEGKKI